MRRLPRTDGGSDGSFRYQGKRKRGRHTGRQTDFLAADEDGWTLYVDGKKGTVRRLAALLSASI